MATITAFIEVDEASKLKFAASFARSKNAANAAMSVWPNDPGFALKQSYLLPFDSVVIAELKRILDVEGEQSLLPSKSELVRDILTRAKAAACDDDYEKLMRLAANMMGHIEKPGTNVDVKVQVQSVMVVKDHGTDEEWAARMAAQQQNLVLNAAN